VIAWVSYVAIVTTLFFSGRKRQAPVPAREKQAVA